ILPNINAKYETGKFSAAKAESIISSAAGAEKILSNEERVLEYARWPVDDYGSTNGVFINNSRK
ncbi:MAG: hypothetical protein K2O97_11820, partial [Acetatifactor sp.]|nr:hypothetical protein [Acetatifactor sp.]